MVRFFLILNQVKRDVLDLFQLNQLFQADGNQVYAVHSVIMFVDIYFTNFSVMHEIVKLLVYQAHLLLISLQNLLFYPMYYQDILSVLNL